jgi:CO/xanthine dehydrogenase Mo-binding subunit
MVLRDIQMVLDNGAYTSWGATTPSVMMIPASSIYRVPNVLFETTIVYTNNTYCQAMRGYGNPQVAWAMESNMDQLAEKAGIDPFEFRKINSNIPNETTPMGLKISTCGMKECLESVAEKLDWKSICGKSDLKARIQMPAQPLWGVPRQGKGAWVWRRSFTWGDRAGFTGRTVPASF